MNKVIDVNVETGEVVERQMTPDELAQWNKDKAESEAKAQERAEAEAKREAAFSKLAALGLTADDLKALGL